MYYLFWIFLGILNSEIWHPFLVGMKYLSQSDLAKISPRFSSIDSEYNAFILPWAIFVLLIPMLFLGTWINSWAIHNYGQWFYPIIVYLSSAYAVGEAVFALKRGVFPVGRLLKFRYGDEAAIRRVAKYQIVSSIVLFCISVIMFFVLPAADS
jgi:hypothetical protein